LHGAGGDHSSWVLNTRIADYVNTTDIAVVMPSGNNRFYINNIHGKDYYTYAVKELITQCEQWFNISRDPKDRYIAGMSMGGYGAFYAALNNPSMYNTAFLGIKPVTNMYFLSGALPIILTAFVDTLSLIVLFILL
jgi:putative tributyrin esterase